VRVHPWAVVLSKATFLAIDPGGVYEASVDSLGALVGVGTVVGPGVVQLDMNLGRTFRITERHRLEVRAEAFNILNHWRPSFPVTALSNSNFGKIQGSGDPRI
jgi:hypothetical protein